MSDSKVKNKKLEIKLVRSIIGAKPDHVQTVRGLGLRKTNSVVVRNDDPCIRGMVNKINYLLAVKEL